ncbi:MAG: FecR domain-containing protein [Verrucomicrobiota bacterium]
MPDTQETLDALLAKLVEETIEPAEVEQLESLLNGDPDAQRRYLHYLSLHRDLEQKGAEIQTSPSSTPRPRISPVLLGIAAAVVTLLVSAALLYFDAEPEIAQITGIDGAVRWIDHRGRIISDLEPLDMLTGGTLEGLNADTWAEIKFLDGTLISVSGHSALTISELEGQKILQLREGQFSIDAAKQPPGLPMKLITASAEAEVLGTQFNVTADSMSTRVIVNEGLVRVKRLADGKVQEVAADQHVIAALELDTEFRATSRKDYTHAWRSNLPRDMRRGLWIPAPQNKGGVLRALPHLWKGQEKSEETSALLFTAVIDPSPGDLPPVRLTEGARLRLSGRSQANDTINFGFATHIERGGFAGKYSAWRDIEIGPSGDRSFEIELPLESFSPTQDRFPDTPVHHEIAYLWVLTAKQAASLEIVKVELIPAK